MSTANRVAQWTPRRRDLLAIGIGGFVAAVPFARQRPLPLVRRTVLTMGTFAKFAVVHRDARLAEAAIDAAVLELGRVDETMSRFKTTSDVGRANVQAATQPVTIGHDTAEVMRAAIEWAPVSGGAFDPCLAHACALWDVAHRHEPPAAGDVARLANRHLYRALEIDRRGDAAVVRFHDPDAGIDLGGIAKGYAVDRAVAVLRAHGIEHALVGAAGDIYALGHSPSGEPWRVGIQSPDDPQGLASTLTLADAAVSTSGTYEQYFDFKGRRYHHLLDPATAAPKQRAERGMTVVASTCLDADAGATTAFMLPREDADRVLSRRHARIAFSV